MNECCQREPNTELVVNRGKQPKRQEAVASELKEVVIGADIAPTQHGRPDFGQIALDIGFEDCLADLNVSIVTPARTDEEGRALLKSLGMPFRA